MDLNNEWNFGYTGTFYLGSNKQPIRAIFDTGSANSWILSKQAVKDKSNANSFSPFDPSTSETFKANEPKKTVRITFGSGSLSGSFAHDQLTIGQAGLFGGNELHVENYNFGLVEQQAVFTGTFDAIVGMAYPSMAEESVTPFFDVLMQEGVLHDEEGNPSNMFAFYMSTNQSDQSELVFGGYNPDRILEGEEIVWHPVVDKLFWSIKLDDIKVGGESLHICDRRDCWMTPDSGTS